MTVNFFETALAAPESFRGGEGRLFVFVPQQFQLFFAFVLGDFFPPFLFQVTHLFYLFQTKNLLLNKIHHHLKYHSFGKKATAEQIILPEKRIFLEKIMLSTAKSVGIRVK